MAKRNGRAPRDMPLTETERILLQGIQAREALLQAEINADMNVALRQIEARLHLRKGSIPRTHIVDFGSAPPRIIPRPEMPDVVSSTGGGDEPEAEPSEAKAE